MGKWEMRAQPHGSTCVLEATRIKGDFNNDGWAAAGPLCNVCMNSAERCSGLRPKEANKCKCMCLLGIKQRASKSTSIGGRMGGQAYIHWNSTTSGKTEGGRGTRERYGQLKRPSRGPPYWPYMAVPRLATSCVTLQRRDPETLSCLAGSGLQALPPQLAARKAMTLGRPVPELCRRRLGA